MNPILLKPKGDAISQVIVEGSPYRDMDVKQYYGEFAETEGVEIIRRNIDFLSRTRDIIVIEGAGSPAEINMMDMDIANMRTAEIADAIASWWSTSNGAGRSPNVRHIDAPARGAAEDVQREIITNLHGSAGIARRRDSRRSNLTGVPVLGVVPHIDLDLPDEDSMFLGERRKDGTLVVGVVRLPRISNFTDFDALSLEPGSQCVSWTNLQRSSECAALIIPGTKNTIDDLAWLREKGFDEAIRSVRGKVPILGVCGGYQMLGVELRDEQGLEGKMAGTTEGLGLLGRGDQFRLL